MQGAKRRRSNATARLCNTAGRQNSRQDVKYLVADAIKDAQEINTIELTKLPKDGAGAKLWQWLRFLTLRKEDEMEEAANDNRHMQDVLATLRTLSADKEERRLAEARDKERRARVGAQLYGEKIGEEIGRKDTARNMKAEGLDTALIMKVTGLPEDEIAAL